MPAWWRKLSLPHWIWLAVAGLVLLALWLIKSLWAGKRRLAVEQELGELRRTYDVETAESDKLSYAQLAKIDSDYLVKVATLEAERERIDAAAVTGRQAMADLWNETMRPGSVPDG